MASCHVHLDDEALIGAAKYYGTRNTQDTVNTALRDAAQRFTRGRALDKLATMGAAGEFDTLPGERSHRR